MADLSQTKFGDKQANKTKKDQPTRVASSQAGHHPTDGPLSGMAPGATRQAGHSNDEYRERVGIPDIVFNTSVDRYFCCGAPSALRARFSLILVVVGASEVLRLGVLREDTDRNDLLELLQ